MLWCPIIVWLKRNVPKWAFVQWLGCSSRLATNERLLNWGMVVKPNRVLRSQVSETHEHLLLRCSYSGMVWSKVLARFQIRRCLFPWTIELGWAMHHLYKSCFKVLAYKLIFATTIYHLWMSFIREGAFCTVHTQM